MPVPTLNVNNFAINELPPNHRTNWFVQWFYACFSQLKRLQQIFQSYWSGSIDNGYWSSSVTYNTGDFVRTINGVFESQVDGNVGNYPDSSLQWLKVLDSFIGSEERASYTSQKLLLEYALNRRFQQAITQAGLTGFKNPTSIVTGGYAPLSDIYISRQPPLFTTFISGRVGDSSSSSYCLRTGSSTYATESEVYADSSSYLCNINVPLSVYNNINTLTSGAANQTILGFVAKVARAGTKYLIVIY